jgi:2,3-bisphosphoglycerate-dependent phosphoglycerate mutase
VSAANLVLVRHGQSEWNRGRRLTGWSDVPLSEQGREEARAVGRLLASGNYRFELAFTSYLERSAETLDLVLGELGQGSLPVQRSWRLNERHYGAMQGMSRPEAARAFGLKQLVTWQSGYRERPPPVAEDDPRNPRLDPRYAGLANDLLPLSESLYDTLDRVLPVWREQILPALKQGQRVLVVAHKTSLRALRKELEGISDADIASLTVKTGEPIAYRIAPGGRVVWHRSLDPSGPLKRWFQAAIGKWIQLSPGRGYQ